MFDDSGILWSQCCVLSFCTASLQFDMASADGTHLWGHQKHLPHQPQLYEFELDLANHDPDHEHEERPGLTPSATKVNTTATISAAGTDQAAYAAAADTQGTLKAGRAEQPKYMSTRAARFSLLAPEYSSDMPVTSKTCHGMLPLLAACNEYNAANIADIFRRQSTAARRPCTRRLL